MRNRFIKGALAAVVALPLAVMGTVAQAGPVIIDGTDANDHGSVTGTTNNAGWKYMEKALDNIAGNMSGTFVKVLRVLGISGSSGLKAKLAIQSAFDQSTLPGSGWSITYTGTGAGTINTEITSLTLTGGSGTGILYIPTVGNTSGDMSSTDLGTLNGLGASVAGFVNTGGGLFAMGESPSGGPAAYGWLSSVIPGIGVTNIGGGGVGTNITLTTAGTAAFPGLTNADLASADPWHNYFTGTFGSLSVLGTAPQGTSTRNIIIGGGAGTVITAPEPASLAIFGLGLASLGFVRRRRAA